MKIKDLTTSAQLKTINKKYKGKLLNTKDKIDILEFIGGADALRIADILKNPVKLTYSRAVTNRKPLKSYYQSDLYKLMLIM